MNDRESARLNAGTRRRGFAGIAVTGALFVAMTSTGTALAARAVPAHSMPSAASTPLPPALGAWKSQKLGNGPGQGDEMTGSFTVIAGEYLTGLHGKITTSAETSCGTGTITVPGEIKIIHATGEDSYGAYNLYAAGVVNTQADPIVQPLRTVIIHNGKRVTGGVEASFVWPPKKGTMTGGEITYGSCELDLAFLHG